MSKIASDVGVATGAISAVKNVTVAKGATVSLTKSNLSSMKHGVKLANQLLSNLSDLVECVKEQSEKFPKIAEIIAIEDSKITF